MCAARDKGWIWDKRQSPFSQFSRRHDVGTLALTVLAFNVTLAVSLRSGYDREAGSGLGKDVPGPHRAQELRAAPSSPKRPELPSDGPLPRFLHSLGPVTGPRSPFPPGPIFPKASQHFLRLYRSVHRGRRRRTLPAPNQCVHRAFCRAKLTDRSGAAFPSFDLDQALLVGGDRPQNLGLCCRGCPDSGPPRPRPR